MAPSGGRAWHPLTKQGGEGSERCGIASRVLRVRNGHAAEDVGKGSSLTSRPEAHLGACSTWMTSRELQETRWAPSIYLRYFFKYKAGLKYNITVVCWRHFGIDIGEDSLFKIGS